MLQYKSLNKKISKMPRLRKNSNKMHIILQLNQFKYRNRYRDNNKNQKIKKKQLPFQI